MIVSHVKLKNWRNFRDVEVDLGDRAFLIGPNASGKSNFLDVFRFLRDIAKSGGGLQKAVEDRGGLSKIRCLAARKYSAVEIEVNLTDSLHPRQELTYALSITQPSKNAGTVVKYEKVLKDGDIVLQRPDSEDMKDPVRLTQTYLEQINANKDFREIADYFKSILYLHLIPQLLRYPKAFTGADISEDSFGRKFLEKIAATPEKTRERYLLKIGDALKRTVPHLTQLEYTFDASEGGTPHLEARYTHWRPTGAKQREDQFSDGTLRLIGLLWSIMENDSLLLLEEPELSLNGAIVRKLPPLIHRLVRTRKKRPQIILSTHSMDLISDKGIGSNEILILRPDNEGTVIEPASTIEDIGLLLAGGMPLSDAVLPYSSPDTADKLDSFE